MTKRKTATKPVDATGEQDDTLDFGALLNFSSDEILEVLARLGPKAGPMVKMLYEGFMGDVRPILKLTPELMGMIGKDAGPVVASFVVALNELMNAEEMKAAMAVSRKISAVNRLLALQAYVAEGFTREEALTLVLQDMASVKSMVSTAIQQTKVSSK